MHSDCTVFQSTGIISILVISTLLPYTEVKSSILPTENILALLCLLLCYFSLCCVLEAGGECRMFLPASSPNTEREIQVNTEGSQRKTHRRNEI